MGKPLPSPPGPPPITNQSEAQEIVGHLSDVMDALQGVVEEETKLLRAGRLRDAAKLAPKKSNLAQLYASDTARLKASRSYFAQHFPSALNALKQRHHHFHALLQLNLTVLATMHAVSEGIMRKLSEEINRKFAPQTYGASGRTIAPKPVLAQPLTVSRVL
jgi:flagellar biosynthesis/type III secretory pathway chaperone